MLCRKKSRLPLPPPCRALFLHALRLPGRLPQGLRRAARGGAPPTAGRHPRAGARHSPGGAAAGRGPRGGRRALPRRRGAAGPSHGDSALRCRPPRAGGRRGLSGAPGRGSLPYSPPPAASPGAALRPFPGRPLTPAPLPARRVARPAPGGRAGARPVPSSGRWAPALPRRKPVLGGSQLVTQPTKLGYVGSRPASIAGC